jgi:hypothetical protein
MADLSGRLVQIDDQQQVVVQPEELIGQLKHREGVTV